MACRKSLVFAFLGLVVAVPSFASQASPVTGSVLGANGEIYTVRQGAYGDLVPGGKEAPANHPVLVLDIQRPGEPTERLLVPHTDDAATESSPTLILETASQRPFILWESWINTIHVGLNLVQLTTSGWSDVVEVSGNPYAFKTGPQFVVTRDDYSVPSEDGQSVRAQRTIVHLVWWESSSPGVERGFYAPLIFENGTYIGSNGVFSFDSLIPRATDTPPVSEPVSSNWSGQLATIQTGEDSHSVILGFVDQTSGHLVSLELHPLPGELIELSDAVKERLDSEAVAAPGAGADNPEVIQQIEQTVDQELSDWSDRFRFGFVDHLVGQLKDFVETRAQAGDSIEMISGGVRAQIIRLGARVAGSPLTRLSAGVRAQIIRLGDHLPRSPQAPDHFLRVGLVSDRPLPVIDETPTSLYVSRSGADALLSWTKDSTLQYRETNETGWGPVQSLQLGPSLNLEEGQQLLRDRFENR